MIHRGVMSCLWLSIKMFFFLLLINCGDYSQSTLCFCMAALGKLIKINNVLKGLRQEIFFVSNVCFKSKHQKT